MGLTVCSVCVCVLSQNMQILCEWYFFFFTKNEIERANIHPLDAIQQKNDTPQMESTRG